ncbi:MAG: BLUF domain-containing protein [Nocardioidaceae bacterium]
MTYYIVYVSSATNLMETPELQVLLDTSRRNNHQLGVTGAMLYQDGNFMQALEGDATVVEQLYRTILRDPRHHGAIRIVDGWSEGPQFSQWSMAFGNLSSDSSALGVGVRDLFESPPAAGHPSPARTLLSSFRTTLNLRGADV